MTSNHQKAACIVWVIQIYLLFGGERVYGIMSRHLKSIMKAITIQEVINKNLGAILVNFEAKIRFSEVFTQIKTTSVKLLSFYFFKE